MAIAIQVLDDGHLGLRADALDQALAATRDDDVNILGHGDERAHSSSVGRRHELHRVFGQTGSERRRTHQRRQRQVGGNRLGAAAQDAGVAAFDGE